ncbi:MAG: type IV pilus modification protein PilV [Candidatus Sedimenticola endophacoides]
MNVKRNVGLTGLPSGGQLGVTLIEVLVAVVILGVGLLGLAGLQLQGLRSVQHNSAQTHALLLAQDLVERIHLNSVNIDDYVGLNADSCGTQSTLARIDYCAVLTRMTGGDLNADGDTDDGGESEAGDMLLRAPAGSSLLSVNSCGGCTSGVGMYTITVTWAEQDRDGTDQSVSYGFNFKP